jgi:site-specific DNA-methyltransferase (adenine-specific)
MSRVTVHHGDCREVLRSLDADSIDAVVTDPPYAFPGGFMGRAWDRFDGREDAAFGYWLAGFVDGEACFRVHRHERGTHTCAFSVHIRRDDRAILEKMKRFVGHGSVCDVEEQGRSKPMARYAVQDKAGCDALVTIFRKYPLRGKKRLDFEAWAEAVEEWLDRPRGNRWQGRSDQTAAAAHKAKIERVREYADPPWSGHPYQDWCRTWALEVYRVLKPGAHLLAFGSTKAHHRLVCALEDVGFEIRDTVLWITGSGFPKSHPIGRAIDRMAGAEREVVGQHPFAARKPRGTWTGEVFGDEPGHGQGPTLTAPATSEAAAWGGWGSALKPSHEPIVLARKPLSEPTVAANVLRWGTGALNIDATRVGMGEEYDPAKVQRQRSARVTWKEGEASGLRSDHEQPTYNAAGRWPANLVHDGSPEVLAAFDLFGTKTSGKQAQGGHVRNSDKTRNAYGAFVGQRCEGDVLYGDTGSAARFFQSCPLSPEELRFHYSSKAGKDDRAGSGHPTIKPLSLMRWLVRMVTPPGGTVLDCFAGSGTTGAAAIAEGFKAVLIEREAEYVADIRRRLGRPAGEDTPLFAGEAA